MSQPTRTSINPTPSHAAAGEVRPGPRWAVYTRSAQRQRLMVSSIETPPTAVDLQERACLSAIAIEDRAASSIVVFRDIGRARTARDDLLRSATRGEFDALMVFHPTRLAPTWRDFDILWSRLATAGVCLRYADGIDLRASYVRTVLFLPAETDSLQGGSQATGTSGDADIPGRAPR